MKKRLLFSIAIMFLSSNLYSQSGNEIEQDFIKMRKYIVAIGTVVSDSIVIENRKIELKKFVTIGSGLATYVKYDTLMIKNIVTAGHIIKYFRENGYKSIYIRPSWADTIKTIDYFGIEIPIVNQNNTPNTFLYPDNNIDLGCILMLPYYFDDIFIKKLEIETDKLFPYNEMKIPYIGNQVWVCGYPGHIEQQIENRFLYSISTFKQGYITWKPSNNMTNKDLYHITLVESNATYGNSGGPVFSLQETIELVGILVGGYNEIDSVYLNNKPLIDPQTQQAFIAKSRSGVSIIEKAEYVKKLLLYVQSIIAKYK